MRTRLTYLKTIVIQYSMHTVHISHYPINSRSKIAAKRLKVKLENVAIANALQSKAGQSQFKYLKFGAQPPSWIS